MSKLTMLDALLDPINHLPRREGEGLYHRRKQLVDIARLASLGSTTHLERLTRMTQENKADAWTFSTADAKGRLKEIFGNSKGGING